MTSTFILGPGEEFIQCPYNTAHQITNVRLLTHLEKCRRSYLKSLTSESQLKAAMKICRYNSLHHYPSPEIKFHEERCRDAFSVVRHMAFHNSAEGERSYEQRRNQDFEAKNYEPPKSSVKTKTDTKPAAGNEWGLEEEDWESESTGYTPGYDPTKKLQSEVVIYNPSGLTKSERKKFRLDVREKAAEMSLNPDQQRNDFPLASDFDVKPDMADLYLHDMKKKPDSNAQRCRSPKSSSSYTHSGQPNANHRSKNEPAPSSSKSRVQFSSTAGPSSSRSRYQQDEASQFSEDDFEGYDPYE